MTKVISWFGEKYRVPFQGSCPNYSVWSLLEGAGDWLWHSNMANCLSALNMSIIWSSCSINVFLSQPRNHTTPELGPWKIPSRPLCPASSWLLLGLNTCNQSVLRSALVKSALCNAGWSEKHGPRFWSTVSYTSVTNTWQTALFVEAGSVQLCSYIHAGIKELKQRRFPDEIQ